MASDPPSHASLMRRKKAELADEILALRRQLGAGANVDTPPSDEAGTAKRAGRENDKLLRAFIDYHKSPITLKSLDGKFLLVNAAFAELRGRDADDIIGRTNADLYEPAVAELLDGQDERVIKRQEMQISGFEIDGVDGANRQFELIKFPIYGDDGTLNAIGTMTNDITERKSSEDRLTQTLSEFSAIMEAIDYGVCFMDSDLRAVILNRAFREMWGFPDDFIRQRPSLAELILFNRYNGVYDIADEDFDTYVEERVAGIREGGIAPGEMMRADGKVYRYQCIELPNGGRMLTYFDMTAQRQLEAAQRQVLESIPIPVVLSDAETNEIFYANEGARKVYGIEVGKPVVSAYRNPEDRQTLVNKLKNEGRVDNFEAGIFNADGEPEWVYMSARMLDFEGKKAVLVASQLITERKRAEEALQQSEEQIRRMLEFSPVGVAIVRQDGVIRFANSRICDMVGLTHAEFVASNARDLYFDPADRDRFLAKMDAEGEVHDFEVRFKTPRNEPLWVILSSQPFEYEGEMDLMAWVYDISERKAAEEEIRKQAAVITATLESMDQGITMFDEELVLSTFNERFVDLLNFPDGVIEIGRSMEELLRFNAERGEYGDGDVDQLVRERIELARQFNPHQFERDLPDGRIVEIKGQPAATGGFVTTYTDITERKLAERKLADAYDIISSSINYASNIQRSILPESNVLSEIFADHFVIWSPKDVVGGDIYLHRKCDNGDLLMLMDCTGHGVPGAFMTMIATGALDQALMEVPDGDPAKLLHRTNQLVKTVLGQIGSDGDSDDGFECGLCLIDADRSEVTYAGARFELWCLKGDDISVTKGDKTGIGYRRTSMDRTFTNHVISTKNDYTFYMTSDGLVDQIGGDKRLAFGKKRLKQIVLDYSKMKMAIQKVQILRAFEEYQYGEERRDDISLVGFRPERQ